MRGNGRENISRVVKTCKEMLRDRGLRVSETHTLPVCMFQTLPFLTGYSRGIDTEIYVSPDEKVGVKFARQVVDKSEAPNLIILSVDGPTPVTRKQLDNVQFLGVKDLCFNVTHHHLVPRHEVVECPVHTSPDKLPCILQTDAVVQYYNWPVGTIVRVWRCYSGNEPTPYFRRVVAPSN